MSKEQKTREQLQLELKEAQSRVDALEKELLSIGSNELEGTFWIEEFGNPNDCPRARLHKVIGMRSEPKPGEHNGYTKTVYVEIAYYKDSRSEHIFECGGGGFDWPNIPSNIKRASKEELERILGLLQISMEAKMIEAIQEKLAKDS